MATFIYDYLILARQQIPIIILKAFHYWTNDGNRCVRNKANWVHLGCIFIISSMKYKIFNLACVSTLSLKLQGDFRSFINVKNGQLIQTQGTAWKDCKREVPTYNAPTSDLKFHFMNSLNDSCNSEGLRFRFNFLKT